MLNVNQNQHNKKNLMYKPITTLFFITNQPKSYCYSYINTCCIGFIVLNKNLIA